MRLLLLLLLLFACGEAREQTTTTTILLPEQRCGSLDHLVCLVVIILGGNVLQKRSHVWHVRS